MDWYYGNADGQMGLVGEDELAGLIRIGRVTHLTPVWNESMADWSRIGEVPELAGYPAEASAHAREPDPEKPRLRVKLPEANLAADPLGRAAPDPKDHFGGVSTHPQKEMWHPGPGRGWTPYGSAVATGDV